VSVRRRRSHKPFPSCPPPIGTLDCRMAGTSTEPFNGKPNMANMKHLLKNLIEEESGQDLIEYALVAALVGLGSVASMNTLAGSIANTFAGVGTALSSAV